MLYKTVWEISQRVILEMAADRGAFIDQSQSLNIHIAEPTTDKLTSMHFFGWNSVSYIAFILTRDEHEVKEYMIVVYHCICNTSTKSLQGLKTGMYYLRTKPAANPIQFTVDESKLRNRDLVSNSSSPSTPTKSPSKDIDDDNNAAEKRNQITQQASKNLEAILVCSRKNGDACMACSS